MQKNISQQGDVIIIKLKELINSTANLKVKDNMLVVDGKEYKASNDIEVLGILNIRNSNIVIDGSNELLEINIKNINSNLALFYIDPNVSNVELRNLNIKVILDNNVNLTRLFCAIYNTSYNLKINNVNITILSQKQINLMGVFNNGTLSLDYNLKANNLSIKNSEFNIICEPDSIEYDSLVYGITNIASNSISIQDTYINVVNKGDSNNQKSIGIYSDGSFGRFIGNNIKANGSHPAGLELEQASAYGIINEGLYTIISNNNIIAEWAGIAIGVENKGNFAIISSNKILSTHNIMGICIRNCANKLLLENNIIVSTSKNARLIEHQGSCSNISNNILEVLLPKTEVSTGCGIYSTHNNIKDNIVSGNIICNVKNCGMIINPLAFSLSNNKIIVEDDLIPITHSDNISMLDVLSERNIKTIVRE